MLILPSRQTRSPAAGDHERVDLHEREVLLHEALAEPRQQLRELLDLVALQPEPERELAALVGHDADERVDGRLQDLLGRVVRDGLDVHAAFGRGHDDDAPAGAVDDHAEVELVGDVAGLLDQHRVDGLPLLVGLEGDEVRAEHGFGVVLGLARGVDELHAAGLATSASVHLRLHDDLLRRELLGGLAGLGRRGGDEIVRDGHAVAREQRLGLVLVKVHGNPRG